MKRWVIDTNVPVVANGRDDTKESFSLDCRKATIDFLTKFLRNEDRVVLDKGREIEEEYRSHLDPKGQPGVGDRFYQEIITNPRKFERVPLSKRDDGEFSDLPQLVIDSKFDRSDRKFAALSKREKVPVVNATDSDWLEAEDLLRKHGIHVEFVCGRDKERWLST